MEIWQIIAVVLGTGGFWRLLDVLIKHKAEQKLKKAETKNLYTSAQDVIVGNWVQWSQTLEKRVKESEEHNAAMKDIINNQKIRIKKLEEKVGAMERKNRELTAQLKILKKTE